MKSLLAAVVLAVTAFFGYGARSASTDPAEGFPLRMVKLAGNPGDETTLAHVRFCKKLGFNALWVYSYEAGAWSKERAPRGPMLDPDFLRLARWCRRHKMQLWVSINPVEDSGEQVVFSDPDTEKRVLTFAAMLRKRAGARRIVLSFDDQPRDLHVLSDVFRYGTGAAPAHLDFTRRVASGLPKGDALWLCAAAYCDAHLGDGTGAYSKGLLEGLPALPPDIGIVWTGPSVLSPTITRAGLEATRARLGGRKLLLYDNFPVNGNEDGDAMALILGALTGREPGIREVVAGYLANPALPLASSRLSLMTTAAFLRDPSRYDPGQAAKDAVASLAGPDPTVVDALTTQQIEWGGFIDTLNYWPRDALNPEATAERLQDPAFVESFTWTVTRYPERMARLSGIVDKPFRDDLLAMMRRRLAVARAVPLVIDYRASTRQGSPGTDEARQRIELERSALTSDPDALHALDLFLTAAGILPGGTTP